MQQTLAGEGQEQVLAVGLGALEPPPVEQGRTGGEAALRAGDGDVATDEALRVLGGLPVHGVPLRHAPPRLEPRAVNIPRSASCIRLPPNYLRKHHSAKGCRPRSGAGRRRARRRRTAPASRHARRCTTGRSLRCGTARPTPGRRRTPTPSVTPASRSRAGHGLASRQATGRHSGVMPRKNSSPSKATGMPSSSL